MSLILGVDTSTVVCAGVARDGVAVASGSIDDPRAHAEQLMPLVRSVLADAGVDLHDLTGITVGVGPGPFTGLRVGVVTAATLGEVLGVPVVGVCSLDVVAKQWADAGAPEEFVVALDARRKEVYWARYVAGQRVEGPSVTSAADVPDLPAAGPGAGLLGRPGAGPETLDAGVLAASELPEVGLEPLYLRRPDAEVATRRKSTLTPQRSGLRRTR
jgi:tRNA threonylcarbamoyl adenosine modification protein YeaZ